jgi:hypothetical protein
VSTDDQHSDLEALRRASAAEQDEAATGGLTQAETADLQDKYERMMRLADVFDRAGDQMRAMSRLGAEVLRDPGLAESAELGPATYRQAEDDIRAATTGKHGLLTRSIEVDADALVVRATVLTYRWIDELQTAAYETLGAIAGRAIGYLAPNVALGGAIVSAGLIETDALDRDGVASYLSELAENNPELMDHVTTGGGGLLDGLQMRSLLTAGVLADDSARVAAQGGLRAIGAADFGVDGGSALRDIAGGLLETTATTPPATVEVDGQRPRTIADLMTALESTVRSVSVHRVGPSRYIAYLAGPGGGGRRLRLVGGDSASYAATVVRTIEAAVEGDPGAHVMLVGSAAGGATAAEVAATLDSTAFVVDQVVTAGAPSAHVPRIPERTRVLSLEDRSDPVALLGSLVNASATNRTTVVFDGSGALEGLSLYVAGGRAADGASHPGVRAEIHRIQQLGYLVG